MDSVLWYMLTGARGGPNRLRILEALAERPRNANQLADHLDLDYTTVRHHLDVLCEHDVLENGGEGYGTVYLPTDQLEANWDTVEEITRKVSDGDHADGDTE